MAAKFFKSAADFRQWLDRHHATKKELIVGYYNKKSGKGGLTYVEAVEEALCYGWIDGVAHKVDDESYSTRFTPRKARSIWSAVNIKRVEALIAADRMMPAGLAAYERRDPALMNRYSGENEPQAFPPELLQTFKLNDVAWRRFNEQPPGYQRAATWFVVSAKKEETRLRRLQQLIEVSSQGKRLPQLVSPSKRAKDA